MYAEYADVSALLVRKSELQRHFTEQGRQSAPVDFIVAGDCRVVGDILSVRELRYVIQEQQHETRVFAVTVAINETYPVSGKSPEALIATR